LTLADEDFTTPLTVYQIGYAGLTTNLSALLGRDLSRGTKNLAIAPLYLSAVHPATVVENRDHSLTVTDALLPDVSLSIGANSVVDGAGNVTTAKISLTEIPLDYAPINLPEEVSPDFLISVQIDGGTLAVPAVLSLPNRAEYVAGTVMNLWGLNFVTGKFEVVGTGWVDGNGRNVLTQNGGISRSGIYFFAPVPKEMVADADNPLVASESNLYQGATESINSEANADDGSVTDTQNLASYQSLGVNHQFQLRYNSKWADPTHFFRATDNNFRPAERYEWLTQRLVIRRGKFVQRVSGASLGTEIAGGVEFSPTSSIGLVGGENFYRLINNASKISTGFLPVDFSHQGSGVYQIEQSVGLKKTVTYIANRPRYFGTTTTTTKDKVVVNRSDSRYGNADFGSGWSLVGLQELLLSRKNSIDTTPIYRDRTVADPNVNDSLPIALIDGNGQEVVYRAGSKNTLTGITTFSGPAGSYATLEKLADGSYRRKMPDQSVYMFDKWGQLASMTDRNNNQTTYSYNDTGHLIGITDPVGLRTTFEVVGDRVMSMMTPDGRITRFNYDGNNLKSIVDAEDGVRKWTYRPEGWMATFTDERGNVGEDYYDRWGRSTGAKLRDGTIKRYTSAEAYIPVYDLSVTANPIGATVVTPPDERTTTTIDGKGQTVTRVLNKEGLTTKIIDDLGVRETNTIRIDNRLGSTKDSYGFVTSYDYDEQGNTTMIVDGDYQFPVSSTKIFGDTISNNHLLEDAESILRNRGGGANGIGAATQASFARGEDGVVYYVIGTSLNYVVVASGLTAAEKALATPQEYGDLRVRDVESLADLVESRNAGAVSLQQIRLLPNGGIAIGYDHHPYDNNSVV
jgi:YD repeat-containing protein